MRRKFILSAVSAFMISAFTFAQEGNNSVKFNLGTSFSKPGDELATVAMDGKNMQLSVSAEAARFMSYKKVFDFIGIRYITECKYLSAIDAFDWRFHRF